MDASRSESPQAPPRPCVFPAYLVVLLIGVLASIVLMHQAAGTWHEARAGAGFTRELQRQIAFAILFSAGVAGAVALAAAGEIVATGVRLFRKAPIGRTAGRLAVALSLMVIMVAGHHFANPWLGDTLRAVRGLGDGGQGEPAP